MNNIQSTTRRSFIKASMMTAGILLTGINFAKRVFADVSVKLARTDGVYQQDRVMKYRKSQDNPEVKTIYKDFLEHPNSHKAHELLHTKYFDRSKKVRELKKHGFKLKV